MRPGHVLGISRVGQFGDIEPAALVADDKPRLVGCEPRRHPDAPVAVRRLADAHGDQLLVRTVVGLAQLGTDLQVSVDDRIQEGLFQGDADPGPFAIREDPEPDTEVLQRVHRGTHQPPVRGE